MNVMNISKVLAGLVLLFVPVGIAFAQGASFGEDDVAAPPNTVSCFDYYKFGSVHANLTAPVTGTVSGASITFSGDLVNDNPYPIVDGSLFVKVFKSRGSTNDGNGPDVVDQFFADGEVSIPANGSVPISFSWRVPSYARSGDYQLATYFVASRKFNLLGLSFTDDVVGNMVPFTVSAERTTGVAFDKAGVTVQDKPFLFAAFPPRVPADEPVVVKANIKNTTSSAQDVSVVWTVYQWDALLRENAVQEETKRVTVPAGGSAPVSITVSDTRYPVYLAVATLSYQDTKSIIGVRFVREGKDKLRINFPGVMAYPLVKGQETTLFSCLHNSGSSPSAPNGRLELSLWDTAGNLIHEYVYAGDVTGAMMGIADAFTPEKNYDKFVLEARLFEGETFIEESRAEYDCEKINPGSCSAEASAFDLASLLGGFGGIAVILVIVALLVIVIFVRKAMASPMEAPPTA